MDLVSRSQWGARPWREPNGSIPYAGTPRGVKVHYLGTTYIDRAHSQCPAYIRGLQAQHMDGNGWSDIGYCVDEDTEILTGDGWKSYSDVRPGDLALTLNHDTGASQWQPIEDVYVFPARDREMIRMEGVSHSSLTTPQHRWPVERMFRRTGTSRQKKPDGTWKATGRSPRSQQGRERTWATTETLNYWDRIPIAAPPDDLPADPKWSDAFVELVGWFWTEGHIKPQSRSRALSTGVAIYQSHETNPELVTRIRTALQQVFGPPVERFPRLSGITDGVPRWREVPNRKLVEFHLSVDAGRLLIEQAPGRVPRVAFLRQLTRAQLALFIEVSMLGDGHNGAGSVQLSQKSRASAEAFQIAVILAGRAATLRPRQPTSSTKTAMWTVTARKQSFLSPRAAARRGAFSITRERYAGQVWCVRTPNATWLARRNGTVYFTGNSLVVCSHGSVYEGRGLRRRNSANGSTELNEGHYAVCALLGSSGLVQPPDRQLHGIRDAIEYCRSKGPAGTEIRGHRDGYATACPGDALYAWVRKGAPRPSSGRENPEDDMPQRRLYGTSDGHRIEIPPGRWRMVTFDRYYEKGKGWQSKKAEPSILFGPCFYSATVAVRVRGLVRGQELQIRLAHFREKEGGGWERSGGMPLSSPVHDGGSLHAVHPWQGHINGSRRGRVRVEVQHFGERAVTLDYARAEALYWPGGP
jgi:hypothetical protein